MITKLTSCWTQLNNEFSQNRDKITNSFRNLGVIYLLMGSVGLLTAEALHIGYSQIIYLVFGSIFLTSIVFTTAYIGCVREATEIQLLTSSTKSRSFLNTPLLIAFIMGISLLISSLHHKNITAYDVIASLASGLTFGSVILVLSQGKPYPSESLSVKHSSAILNSLIAIVILGAEIALRYSFAGTWFLTWVIAPVTLFVAPGLGVSSLLLSSELRGVERILMVIPISIGVQVISWMWLMWLGIPLSLNTALLVSFFAIATSAILNFLKLVRFSYDF